MLFMTAEHLMERHIRRPIPYRWIVRHNAGEELPLPSGPIPALKTHGSLSGSITTTSPSRRGADHSIVRATARLCPCVTSANEDYGDKRAIFVDFPRDRLRYVAGLLDHLISQQEQRGGHRNPQRLGGFEVDD